MREGWVRTTLGEISDRSIGRTPPRKDARYWTPDVTERPFCTIADMKNGTIRGAGEGVTELAEAEGKAKRFPKGSLLLSFKLSLGRVAFAPVDLFPNEAIAWVRPRSGVMDKFLALALENIDWDGQGSRAVKGKTLNSESLDALPIVLPPLEEQQRIVDLIGSLDGTIEAADAAADVARFATSCLQEEILSPASDWSSSKLGDMARVRRGATWGKAQESTTASDGTEPVVGIAVTSGSGYLDLSKMKFVAGLKENVTRLTPLDLLMVMSNGNPDRIGNVYLVDDRLSGMPFSAFQMSIRIVGDDIDPEFLFYTLASRASQESFTDMTAGSTGLRNLNLSKVNAFEVSYPSWSKQREIVDMLSSAHEGVDKTYDLAESLRSTRSELLTVLLSGEHEIPESYDVDTEVQLEPAA